MTGKEQIYLRTQLVEVYEKFDALEAEIVQIAQAKDYEIGSMELDLRGLAQELGEELGELRAQLIGHL